MIPLSQLPNFIAMLEGFLFTMWTPTLVELWWRSSEEQMDTCLEVVSLIWFDNGKSAGILVSPGSVGLGSCIWYWLGFPVARFVRGVTWLRSCELSGNICMDWFVPWYITAGFLGTQDTPGRKSSTSKLFKRQTCLPSKLAAIRFACCLLLLHLSYFGMMNQT